MHRSLNETSGRQDDHGQIDFLFLKLVFVRLNLGEVEQVVDQIEQMGAAGVNIHYVTRIRGFSGCCLELIAGLKIELGLERVDLVGGDGRDDVNEGVDDGSMLGQIEG